MDLNATQAAIRAGYSEKGASVRGTNLLIISSVKAEIERRGARILKTTELSVETVLNRLLCILDADPGDSFDEEGNLRHIKDLTEAQRKAVASFEIVKRNLESGDNTTEQVYKVKFWDKMKAIELSGKYLQLFTEKIELSVDEELLDRLAAGRRRLAELGSAIEAEQITDGSQEEPQEVVKPSPEST